MSAFVVSNKHINAMVGSVHPEYPGDSLWYYFNDEQKFFDPQKAGEILLAQNVRSVNARYHSDEKYEAFKYNPYDAGRYSPVQIIKACACYEYQACETGDLEETEAGVINTFIRERAIRNLPGYNEAEWGID